MIIKWIFFEHYKLWIKTKNNGFTNFVKNKKPWPRKEKRAEKINLVRSPLTVFISGCLNKGHDLGPVNEHCQRKKRIISEAKRKCLINQRCLCKF